MLRRVARLGPHAQEILGAAAVLGPSFQAAAIPPIATVTREEAIATCSTARSRRACWRDRRSRRQAHLRPRPDPPDALRRAGADRPRAAARPDRPDARVPPQGASPPPRGAGAPLLRGAPLARRRAGASLRPRGRRQRRGGARLGGRRARSSSARSSSTSCASRPIRPTAASCCSRWATCASAAARPTSRRPSPRRPSSPAGASSSQLARAAIGYAGSLLRGRRRRPDADRPAARGAARARPRRGAGPARPGPGPARRDPPLRRRGAALDGGGARRRSTLARELGDDRVLTAALQGAIPRCCTPRTSPTGWP